MKLEFWIYGNPEPVIKKIDHSIKTRNDDIFNIEVNYEDHITIENIEKNHAKNQLTSYGMDTIEFSWAMRNTAQVFQRRPNTSRLYDTEAINGFVC